MDGTDALKRIYTMALHSEDLSGSPMSSENKQALAIVDRMIRTQSPSACPVLAQDYSNVPAEIPYEAPYEAWPNTQVSA